MKSSARNGAERKTRVGASAVKRSGAKSLTLGDAVGAATDTAYAGDAAVILQALFESRRIRFTSPSAQRNVDRLARLLHPDNCARSSTESAACDAGAA